ncbi:hypothetical protein [Nitrospirillum viridazoti]|uniref:Sel1 repeat-containing protein n=1 Tax=Nitrospirillum amazonense TaxID=28077 RepID=A0A560IH06_9PROT|nr:hypothetical protein [Nitrospirillum amazonense]TWB56364.1 hypothetical protein FBZ92_112153 [Nitrospirillum amazonense]
MSEGDDRFSQEIDGATLEKLYALAWKHEDAGDRDAAVLLFKIGAHFGEPMSMCVLADILSEPPRFPDIKTAEELYKKAGMAGYATAFHNLAVMYGHVGKSELSQRYMKIATDRGAGPWEDDNDEGAPD